jgi:hypothetical protein
MRDALAARLAGRGVEVVELDVDAHPPLEAQWGDQVPVLLEGDAATGREICHYHLDAAALTRALGPNSAG